MQQRDYILRLIEQAGEVLIELRNRILGGDSATRLEQQLQNVGRKLGIDLELARVATADTLAMIVAPTGDVEPGRCWLLAESLYLDGLQAEMSGRVDDALDRYDKAARLFRLLGPGGAYLVGFPEAKERIAEIESRARRLTDGPAEAG